MNYKKAAKRPPATATKLMPKVAPAATETIGGDEPVEVPMLPVLEADPEPVAVGLDELELTTAGSIVAL
jgi:hypothetical protein